LRLSLASGLDLSDLCARFGITRLADLTGLDTVGLPVWAAVRPGAWSLAQCQGKGMTDAQARISAVMEAVETSLAEQAADLAADLAVAQGPPPAMPGAIALATALRCTDPGAAAATPMLWLPGRGLRTGAPCLVPLPLVTLDFRINAVAGATHFHLSSTGLAAHPDRTDAERHALLEGIETDALALARSWPGILDAAPEPPPLDDPDIATIRARLAQVGLTPILRDITSDLGLPVALCWLAEEGPRPRLRPFAGSACRPTWAAAIRDAMLEAAQSRLTDIAGAREDITDADFARAPPLPPKSQGPTVASLARPLPEGQSAADDLTAILDRLAAAALPEPVAVDLDRPGDGITCVSLHVPGLEAEGGRRGPRARARTLRHGLGLP
jgi:YcaO-like protein with predicted kinase domain